MKYVITGNRMNVSEDYVKEALYHLTSNDSVFITGSSPAEDIAARLAYQAGAELVHKPLDNILHGTNSRVYEVSKQIDSADCLILFYKRKDKDLQELISKADELSVEVREFIIK